MAPFVVTGNDSVANRRAMQTTIINATTFIISLYEHIVGNILTYYIGQSLSRWSQVNRFY